MAVTLDLKIKPYTDSTDVRKVAGELKRALNDALDKNSDSKDKRIMSLNNQVKSTIQTIDKLERELDNLSKASYTPKFASKIQAEVSKMELAMRNVEDIQDALQAIGENPLDLSEAGAELVELDNIVTELSKQIEDMYSADNFDAEVFQELVQQSNEARSRMQELYNDPNFNPYGPETQEAINDFATGLQNAQRAVQDASTKINDLQQQEVASQQAWEQANTEAQQKIRQEMDATTDRAKVQLTQCKEMGSKMATAMQVVLPILGTLRSTVSRTLSAVPQTLNKIIGLVHRLTNIIHLPKISTGIRDIFRQLKRSTTFIAGVILGARGLQSILNKLRSSILAGFKDVYNQDKQFKTQIDTIKQKVLDIQVAFAEALMPVIQMALPYIKQLLDWVMNLLGVLQRFISTVTGIKAYTKAIKGLGGAAQNANKQLSKLDELNNLTTGGGSGLTPDASSIGDPKKIEDWFKFTRNIIDEIEKMLRAIPWDEIYKKANKFGYAVGQILNAVFKPSFWNAVGMTLGGVLNTILHFFNTLGNTLKFEKIGKSFVEGVRGFFDMFDWNLLSSTLITWADGFWTIIKTILTDRDQNGQTLAERIVSMITNSLSQIKWSSIYAKVQEIARTLAETLNQIIDPNMAKEIGRTLGGTLMSIIKFAISFFGEGGVDWENLGKTISEGLNGFFEQFDGSEAATAINSFVHAIITTIKTVIAETDWDEVWSDLKTMLSEIDWKSLLIVILPLLAKTLTGIGLDVVKLVWKLVKKPLLSFLQTTVWPEIVSFFETIFANPVGLVKTVGSFVEGLLAAIYAALAGFQIGNGLGESIALLMGDYDLAEAYEDASLLSVFGIDMDLWEESWFEYFDDIKDGWTMIIDDFKNNPLAGIIFAPGDGAALKKKAEEIFNNIMDAWTEFSDTILSACTLWFEDNIKPFFSIETWETLVQPIWDTITTVWTNVSTWWNTNIVAWWNTKVVPWFTLAKWLGIVTNIQTAIINIWTQAKNWWATNISAWWNNNVSPWFTLAKWTTLLQTIQTAFSTAFKGAANAAIDALNKVIGAVETFVNNDMFSALNGMISGINSMTKGKITLPSISSSVSLPKIPALAQGTVIPPSMGDFIARLGDNNQETEVVSPLSTMKEALQEVLANSNIGGDITVNLTVDGRVLAQTIVKQNEIYRKSTGRNLI